MISTIININLRTLKRYILSNGLRIKVFAAARIVSAIVGS